MRVTVKNNQIQWQDLVGKEFLYENIRVVCSAHENDSLYINEWIGTNITGKTSVISTIDRNKCLAHLKIFGYQIEFIELFEYSERTVRKIEGLIQAGFTKLIKSENNYMVDNIFLQSFLLENELQYLLSDEIEEIKLIDFIQ